MFEELLEVYYNKQVFHISYNEDVWEDMVKYVKHTLKNRFPKQKYENLEDFMRRRYPVEDSDMSYKELDSLPLKERFYCTVILAMSKFIKKCEEQGRVVYTEWGV